MTDTQYIHDRIEYVIGEASSLLSLTEGYSGYDGTTGEIITSAEDDISYAVYKLGDALRKVKKTL